MTLYASGLLDPDNAAMVAIVGVSPSIVIVALRGLFDCMTKMLIPDPDPVTNEQLFLIELKDARL